MDVDILVSFPPRHDMFSQHITLASELTDLLGRTVNLITEHEVNPHLRDYLGEIDAETVEQVIERQL